MDGLLDAWMDLGPTVAPDRLANATRAQVRTMPQRRATWWPVRRSLEMSNTLRYAVAGVAIAAALILGVLILMPGT